MTESTSKILLVEDNIGDVDLVKEALRLWGIRFDLSVVKDGSEAISYFNDSKLSDAPDLILLDLNLPKVDGFEVLKHLKQGAHSKIPVVVFTSSSAEEDIRKSYSLNANCYVTKPFSLDQYIDIIKKIGEFWLGIVKLPH
ncbi:MAG: response regulator [Oligoflexia bacterium]|nr:response regulator [Oligoflexia bacterium]